MFTSTAARALLALLPLTLTLAAPTPVVEHLAPLRRAVDVGSRHADGNYIVSLKSDTVDPNNRGQWLNKVLDAHNVTLDYHTTQNLKLRWNKAIFDGIAGTFSPEALNVLRKQPEVAYIQEGPSLSHNSH
jgi:cerevisin